MNNVTKEQENWGAMITLLSLDVVIPFYNHLGLDINNSKEFLNLLRTDILANREEYIKNTQTIPDLKKRNLKSLNHFYGGIFAKKLEDWFQDSFVWHPSDSGIYGYWKMLLSISRNDNKRWYQLDLPKNIVKQARSKFESDVIDKTELHALADEIDEMPHTRWDIEMFSLHGFDDYDNDPYNAVLFIIGYRKIKTYLKWLVSSLNDKEVKQFVDSANHLQESISALQPIKKLYIPEEIKGAYNS